MSFLTRPLCSFRHYWQCHSIITRLSSWFGIHGSVLSWFKSYLSSRCFRVKCKPTCPPGTHPPAVSPRLCPWSTTFRHVHHSSVLSWFKSYLSSRCFRVKCKTDLSSWHILLRCPQGFVLGPLLFVMYTTPLSTLIFSCSLNHHLYADDTQLCLSFLPTHFDSSVTFTMH